VLHLVDRGHALAGLLHQLVDRRHSVTFKSSFDRMKTHVQPRRRAPSHGFSAAIEPRNIEKVMANSKPGRKVNQRAGTPPASCSPAIKQKMTSTPGVEVIGPAGEG